MSKELEYHENKLKSVLDELSSMGEQGQRYAAKTAESMGCIKTIIGLMQQQQHVYQTPLRYANTGQRVLSEPGDYASEPHAVFPREGQSGSYASEMAYFQSMQQGYFLKSFEATIDTMRKSSLGNRPRMATALDVLRKAYNLEMGIDTFADVFGPKKEPESNSAANAEFTPEASQRVKAGLDAAISGFHFIYALPNVPHIARVFYSEFSNEWQLETQCSGVIASASGEPGSIWKTRSFGVSIPANYRFRIELNAASIYILGEGSKKLKKYLAEKAQHTHLKSIAEDARKAFLAFNKPAAQAAESLGRLASSTQKALAEEITEGKLKARVYYDTYAAEWVVSVKGEGILGSVDDATARAKVRCFEETPLAAFFDDKSVNSIFKKALAIILQRPRIDAE